MGERTLQGGALKRQRTAASSDAPRRVSIVGAATCPVHLAAERLLRRVQDQLPAALPAEAAQVQTLPDMASFRAWLQEQGCPAGTTSPLCRSDGEHLGGFAELHAWLADRAEASQRERDGDGGADVILLSLKKHLRGRWLLDLRLAFAFAGAKTKVACIDDDGGPNCLWGAGGRLGACLDPESRNLPSGRPTWRVLLNCVSDAAPPQVQQQLIAAMRVAEATGVLVLNGPAAHAACAAKVSQHALLRQLGLPSPRTVAVSCASGEALAMLADQEGLNYPLLLKPNAGGFGNGIVSFASRQELQSAGGPTSPCLQGAFAGGGLALLQEQLASAGGRVGRIWLLEGEVLCAVLAPLMSVGRQGKTSASGCMADCAAAAAAEAWAPSATICSEVRALARQAGACWGSVELLFPVDADSEEGGRRVYFDLNLSCVSTLPDPAAVADPAKLWRADFQPYDEVARAVLKRLARMEPHS